jgi:hypothetical protein
MQYGCTIMNENAVKCKSFTTILLPLRRSKNGIHLPQERHRYLVLQHNLRGQKISGNYENKRQAVREAHSRS